MNELETYHLNKHLCFALYTASHALVNSYSKRLSEVGLSYEQYLVMVLLWQHQQLSLPELADKLYIGDQAIQVIINSLESANLVERQHCSKGELIQVISLTELGTEIQQKTTQIQHQFVCEAGLTQLEHLQLRERLDTLLDHLKTRVQRTDLWINNLPADL